MSPLPVAFSLMASFMSAITLLGVTFENYTFGTQFMIINLSYAIGKIRVVYDRVWKRKNYFEILAFLQIEWGKSRAGKFKTSFWICCSWFSSFNLKKGGNYKIIFPFPYPIIYNPGGILNWKKKLYFKTLTFFAVTFIPSDIYSQWRLFLFLGINDLGINVLGINVF